VDLIFELSYALCDYGRCYIELSRRGGKTSEAGDDEKRVDVQDGVDETLSERFLKLRKLIAHFVSSVAAPACCRPRG
jgi:hypothetical protein